MDFQLNLESETVEHAHPGEPTCIGPDSTVREALALLRQIRRGVVLICREGVLEGIFTERDVLRLMAEGADWDQPISQVMVRDPVTLTTSATVGKAIAMMAEGGYRRIPIVDDQRRPVGLLKVSGILRYLVEHFPQVVYTLPPSPHHTSRKREGA